MLHNTLNTKYTQKFVFIRSIYIFITLVFRVPTPGETSWNHTDLFSLCVSPGAAIYRVEVKLLTLSQVKSVKGELLDEVRSIRSRQIRSKVVKGGVSGGNFPSKSTFFMHFPSISAFFMHFRHHIFPFSHFF